MAKKILVIYYSQTGQLGQILDRFTEPIKKAGHSVEMLAVKPEKDFPFPWTGKSFFAAMPDCVLGTACKLRPFKLNETSYDLVIIGYQPWFLSPSIPTHAILTNSELKALVKNTPVVTVTGARNMWISAMEKIKISLRESGARLVGNVALVDKTSNLISVVTISYWMFTGKKDRFLSVFPNPGVSEKDIGHSSIYGSIVEKHLASGDWHSLQNELFEQKAVIIDYNLMFTELKGARLFTIWAGFIANRKNKTAWLVVFKYYLIIALFIVAPIILTINSLLVKPFIGNRIKKQIHYYSGVN